MPVFNKKWKEISLDNACVRVIVGLATSVTQYYRHSGTVLFRNLNIKPNYLDDSDILYLDRDFADSNPGKVIHAGDVLTVHTGYVGISCVVPEKYEGSLSFTTLISTTKKDILLPQYLAYHLNSSLGKAEIENLQAGGGRNNLNVADFKKYKLWIPKDKKEQSAIISILSNIDSLIANLEKLIAKKKNIKQGAMQELLTGKRRLPGFGEEWIEYSLGDVLIVRHGQSQHGIENPAGKYPILATGGIIGRTNQYLCCNPSVLIGRKGTIDKPQFMDAPFWTIDTLFYTTIKNGFDAKYIYYIFCIIPWTDFNEATGIPSLSAKVIEKVKITLPSHKEQVAIQTVLSDMDSEIDELEKKLVKYRNIKKGMMSELLTGHIRLTDKEGA